MNRYFTVCRLRWPALLLLTGVLALLRQMDLVRWSQVWPLYLILLGVLALAEREALATEPQAPPPAGYPYGAGYPASGYAAGYAPQPAPYAAPAAGAPPVSSASTEIVPAHTNLEPGTADLDRTPRKSWEEEER